MGIFGLLDEADASPGATAPAREIVTDPEHY